MIDQTELAGSSTLPGTSITLSRMGYGAMQLAGRDGNKLVWGPPRDVDGFTPLDLATPSDLAARLEASPMQVALAWLLQRSPSVLVIPGTSSLKHLRENLQASMLQIPSEVMADLDSIGRRPGH